MQVFEKLSAYFGINYKWHYTFLVTLRTKNIYSVKLLNIDALCKFLLKQMIFYGLEFLYILFEILKKSFVFIVFNGFNWREKIYYLYQCFKWYLQKKILIRYLLYYMGTMHL